MKKIIFFILLAYIYFLFSCNNTQKENSNTRLAYFDGIAHGNIFYQFHDYTDRTLSDIIVVLDSINDKKLAIKFDKNQKIVRIVETLHGKAYYKKIYNQIYLDSCDNYPTNKIK